MGRRSSIHPMPKSKVYASGNMTFELISDGQIAILALELTSTGGKVGFKSPACAVPLGKAEVALMVDHATPFLHEALSLWIKSNKSPADDEISCPSCGSRNHIKDTAGCICMRCNTLWHP